MCYEDRSGFRCSFGSEQFSSKQQIQTEKKVKQQCKNYIRNSSGNENKNKEGCLDGQRCLLVGDKSAGTVPGIVGRAIRKINVVDLSGTFL